MQNQNKYQFYFFSHFKPQYPFIEVSITADEWGRYDRISMKQYETADYWWVVQLFDSKEHFFTMEYEYNLFLPSKVDIEEYIKLIDSLYH